MDPRDIAPARWADARRRSIAAAEAWSRSADRLAFVDAFDDAALASVAVARDRAVGLLSDRVLPHRLLAGMTGALAAEPLLDPPLRATGDAGHIGAILFDVPAARMSATLVSARTLTRTHDAAALLPGHVTVTRYVRANRTCLRRWRLNASGDRLEEIAPLCPADGDVVVHDGRSEAQAIVSADGVVATLSILLRAGARSTVRAFRRSDGLPVRTASTDDAAARTAMLLTLLRISGRRDAASVFDAATHDPAAHARWSAMREWLALDTRAALPRLKVLAATETDADVRAVAVATLSLVAQRDAACLA